MDKTLKKLRSRRGETLAETLVSIVILALSVSLLFVMLSASGKVSAASDGSENRFREALNAVEEQDQDAFAGEWDVKICPYGAEYGVTVKVDGYEKDGFKSYMPK